MTSHFGSDESLNPQVDQSNMSERERGPDRNQRRSAGLVFLLLSSTLLALSIAPTASAVSGSLGISDSPSPAPDKWYNAYERITFTAEVSNYIGSSDGVGRAMSWYACEGDVPSNTCVADPDEEGTFTLTNIPGSSSANFTSPDRWRPGTGTEGVYTVVYAFAADDQNAADDEFSFQINITQHFSDITVNENHDVLGNVENLATFNDNRILNTGTDYGLTASGVVISCTTCGLDASMGWQLWNADGTILLDQAYRNVTDLPNWGGSASWNQPLPNLTHSTEGTYLLKWGSFNSIGTPYGDKNLQDNLAETQLVFNNSLDVEVMDVYPTHSQEATTFYYGNDRLTSVLRNKGNVTVENIQVSLEVLSPQFQVEVEETCTIAQLHPGQSTNCLFPMTTTGDGRTVRVSMPMIYSTGQDVRTSDNLYTLQADVEVGAINPTIQINSQQNLFSASEDIQLVARYSEIASQPLNFTWRQGFFVWGYGQVFNQTGETFGLGSHNVTLVARDPWGEEAYAYVEFNVLNAIPLSLEPYATGEAVTEQPANHEMSLHLPVLGSNYGIGGGLSPLMMLDVDLTPQQGTDIGLRGIDLTLNLPAILPDDIDLSTIGLRYLPSIESQLWTPLDGEKYYTLNQDGTASVHLNEPGVVLITGVLPEINVSAVDVTWSPLRAGHIELSFDHQGNTANPYIGGWAIYKLTGIAGSTFFPDPSQETSEFIWDELTRDSRVATIATVTTQWEDPDPLPTGVCASYAIAPVDRETSPNLEMVSITRVNGEAGLVCGDAVPPTSTVTNFNHEWSFSNDTACFDRQEDWSVCYDVTLTWTWPAQEVQGNVSWDLYRIERQPAGVDLSFLRPVAEELRGVPGEQGSFNQTGMDIDGIRPYRTYYYILAPIDAVGNEQFIATAGSPNVERVQINDDWWSYNQHIIPPEPEPPEPPLGIEWLQTLNDALATDEFQTVGLVMLALVLINSIALPVILKKNKRLKRVIAARQKNAANRDIDMDFDDFFE